MKKILLSLIVTAGTLGVRAQTITWGTPQTISGPSDVVNTGTLFGGLAGDPGLTVNGVTFVNSLPDEDLVGFPNSSSGFGSPGTSDANYNTLLASGSYGADYNNPGAVVATLSWGGMTVGDTYEVELWVEDLNNNAFSRYEYLSGGNVYTIDTSSAVNFPADGAGKGQFITGTFVAAGSTETIGFTPVATAANEATPQINLFQVRDITAAPEPSTLALAGIGGLGLLLYRQRK